MSQTWPLSQDANKRSGLCSVCRATRQLHLKDGTVHKHGPRENPCSGSHKPPVGHADASNSRVTGAASATAVQAVTSAASASDTTTVAVASSQTTPSQHQWCPTDCTIIKHIPKSARPLCASHLSSVLRAIVAKPGDYNNWLAMFNWSSTILQPPKRGGKRHNLSNTIKKRISDFTPTISQAQVSHGRSSSRRAQSPDHLLAQAVTSKLEDGNLRAAIRLICSGGTPAPPSREIGANCRKNIHQHTRQAGVSQLQRS